MSNPFGDNPLGALMRAIENDKPTITVDDTPRPLKRSLAFDVVSIAAALVEFEEHFRTEAGLPKITFTGINADQAAFLEYMETHRDELKAATGLTSLASADHAVLNSFLAANGSSRTFDPFNGVGVVTIYRMLVAWMHRAEASTLKFQGDTYAAFTVPQNGVRIWQLQDNGGSTFERVVLGLPTKTGHMLYMSELPPDMPAPTSAMDLTSIVDQLHRAERTLTDYAMYGAKLPMIGFRTNTDQDWLKGLIAQLPGDFLTLAQATQDWKVDINEIGAKVEVVTTVTMERSAPSLCGPFTIDQPVFVWVVAPGSGLPQGVMFCHPEDTWIKMS